MDTENALQVEAAIARCATARRLPELLAPAGTLDAALVALVAGADAVYVGLAAPGLDARAAAPGLTFEELRDLCALAHAGTAPAYGVYGQVEGTPACSAEISRTERRPARVYVTLNALVATEGIDAALDAARRAHAAGADAFIVADLGLARCLATALPGVELHLSTQAGAQAPEAVRFAADEFGFSRVTVARELSLGEIADACATGVEIEAFCHGAICICYSGACAFSALTRGRSAMHGDCTQPCRQSWRIEDASGRQLACDVGDKLLCPKDFLGIRQLPELVRAGVAALKIEGRMKHADYVYNVVSVYREALDVLVDTPALDVDALEGRLGRSFNRGFTDAYLRGDRAGTGRALMSLERSCNQGAPVGTVVARGHHEAMVELTDAVEAGDTLEIHTVLPADAAPDVPSRWPLVPCPVDGAAGECIPVPCKRRVEAGSAVYVTASARLRGAAETAVAQGRRAMEDVVAAASGRPVLGSASGGSMSRHPATPGVGSSVDLESARRERTSVRAATRGARVDSLARRGAVRAAADTAGPGADVSWAASPTLATSPGRARELLDTGRGAEVAVLAWQIAEEPDAWEALLPRMTVVLDEVCRAADVAVAEGLIQVAQRVVCRNVAQIPLARAAGASFDVAVPIYVENVAAAEALANCGARRIWVPDELDDASAAQLAAELRQRDADIALGRLDLGPRELMVMEHCMLTTEGPCGGACATCSRRAQARFLVAGEGTRYPIRVDGHGRSRIFLSEESSRG